MLNLILKINMKLKINYTPNCSLKNIQQIDIFSKVLNSNIIKNKKNKKVYYRNELLNQSSSLWKTYNGIKDNPKSKKYYNSNYLISSDKMNRIEKIKSKKKAIFSASLIKKANINNYDNSDKYSQRLIFQNNNFSIRKLHYMISLIEKKMNLLHNMNNTHDKHFSFNDKNINNNNTNKISPINKIIKRNNKKMTTLKNSKLIYKYKKPSFLSSSKENINLNKIENNGRNNSNIVGNKLTKSDLIPYPYKRMQKKLRKFFSFSKNINLPEEELPIFFPSNKFQIKNDGIIITNSKNIYNNKIKNINEGKNNNDNYNNNKKKKITHNYVKNIDKFNQSSRNTKIIIKEDKSVGTENTFIERNNIILDNNKNIPLFNNELIASKTVDNENKFFITTKELEADENNKKIFNINYKKY